MATPNDANPSQPYELVGGWDDTNHQKVLIRAKNVSTDSSVTPNIVVGDMGVDVEVTVAGITNDGTFAKESGGNLAALVTGINLSKVGGNVIAPGNAAVPMLNSAATGYVAAYGSNAAALTSSTDYAFKWGAGGTTQVNHIMLQNNTAASINWDLDVAANAGSPTLAAGQTIFLDVQTTALHLFQAGTPNVNGSSSGNIVVRAWL